MNPSAATPADPCRRPIFIIGTERSGSNLLRLVLNTHSRIFIPHPPHIMRLMAPFEPSYGGRSRELAQDVCRLVRTHTFPWDIRLDPDEVLETCEGARDLFSLYAAVHELYRRSSGKARWGCKSTFMVDEVDRILARFPEAQLIHLVRDPRDVAVSARDSVFNHFHPWFVAQRWRREQRIAIGLRETLSPAQIFPLRYEDLLADPEGCVRALCAFLGEAFEPAQMSFFQTDEARRSASLCQDWRNTDTAILRDNTRKFVWMLKPREIAMIEALTEEEMTRLGYPLTTTPHERRIAAQPSALDLGTYALADLAWKARAEARSLLHDRNRGLRVRKWLFLRWLWLKSKWR